MGALERQSHLRRIEADTFDLLIIGGGITGACLAYDAATRGIKTALVERSDFGHATSSASSKLLHGGIRYLQQLRLDKVRESAFERIYFQNLAPHLCRYVPFLVPTFSGLRGGKAFLAAAAVAYMAATLGQNREALFSEIKVPMPRLIGRAEVVSRVPWLGSAWPGTGALMLPECHMKNSERMTLALIRGAADAGAALVNYVSAKSIAMSKSRIGPVSVATDDGSSFQVRAKVVANCAGPWLGAVDAAATGINRSPISSFSRGAHLVLRKLQLECALALPTPLKIQGVTGRGGRHVFLIPWRDHVLLGTSYAPHRGNIDQVVATPNDVAQLLEAVNAAMGSEFLTERHIVHAFAGLYPLTARSVKEDQYQGAHDSIVTDHGKLDGPRGYFSIFGAKFTTARKVAEVACDAIAKQIGKEVGPCITRASTLDPADMADPLAFCEGAVSRYRAKVDRSTLQCLYDNFGRDLEKILAIAADTPQLFERLADDRDDIAAEAVYCARHEMIVHLDDFVFRRTGLGTIGNPGKKAIQRCAALIGGELGWSTQRVGAEIENTLAMFPESVSRADR